MVDAIYIFHDDGWSSKLALFAWETGQINWYFETLHASQKKGQIGSESKAWKL